MKPEWLIDLHVRVAPCDWHVPIDSVMHVGFMNPLMLRRMPKKAGKPGNEAIRTVRITTNSIAAKILQQNNFGRGKFPINILALVWERD